MNKLTHLTLTHQVNTQNTCLDFLLQYRRYLEIVNNLRSKPVTVTSNEPST